MKLKSMIAAAALLTASSTAALAAESSSTLADSEADFQVVMLTDSQMDDVTAGHIVLDIFGNRVPHIGPFINWLGFVDYGLHW